MKSSIERDVVRALRQVFDPEIPSNIYDLGLIYELNIDEKNKAFIKMTLTAPGCPMADEIVDNVAQAVKDVPGITDVSIELVFDPAWDKSMMSEEALLDLGML
ncbi:MAG: iron-sulfur cluster assembly protein [Bacteroidales bacterium]|nr:iron-sulfur cluster assembly protein [Bacteroidales bacterium]